MVECQNVIFSEKTSGIGKKKNVKSVPIPLEIDAQEKISGVHVNKNEDEEKE
jgi:hypothetical protein